MVAIENPFAGYDIGYTWAQHKADPRNLQGGTDYKVGPDRPVTAAADGYATKLSPSEVSIRYAAGHYITVRELKSTVGKFPRNVKRGETIGKTGLFRGGITRWPHIDRTVNGVRLAFEPALTGIDTAGGGSPIPIPTPETDINAMGLQYIRTSKTDASKIQLTNGFNLVKVDDAHASFIVRWIDNPTDNALDANQMKALWGYMSEMNKDYIAAINKNQGSGTATAIDYNLIASKVADKIAARLVS